MASTKVKGIIIKATQAKEKDVNVKIYTLEKGIIDAIFKGVRSFKAKFKACKEIFTFAEFVLEGELNVVSGVSVIDNFYNLSLDYKKLCCGSALVEALQFCQKELQPNSNLFLSFIKSLETITYDDVNLYYVLNKFLIDIFAFGGLKFLFETCNNCGQPLKQTRFFNLDYAEIVCPFCRTGFYVEISTSVHKTMQILNETEYNKLKNLKLSQNSEIETYKILELNFEHQYGKRILLKD